MPRNASVATCEQRIYKRSEHPISRRDIDEHALQLMHRLTSLGFSAYLVGGAVRDLYLGKKPKDFDIATDAKPSRLKKVFRNSRIIGRRFRIAHVYFPDGKIIEVSTFRRGNQVTVQGRRGPILRDNEYGSPEEDALRRDLTINGLFYDVDTLSVIDYVGGLEDLRKGIVRTIADPDLSFQEDPVRMIRAQRHAARTGFTVDELTLDSIRRNGARIHDANPSRLLEELLKDLRSGAGEPYFRLILESGFFSFLAPAIATQVAATGSDHPFWRRMRVLDESVREGATPPSSVLFGLFLQTVLFPDPTLWDGSRPNPPDAWNYVKRNFLDATEGFRVSHRDNDRITQILIAFPKLVQCLERGRLLPALAKKPYILDALSFLELDLRSRGESTEIVTEWQRQTPVEDLEAEPRGRRRGRSRRRVGTGEGGDSQPRESATSTEARSDDSGGEGGAPEGSPSRPRRRRRRRRGGGRGKPGGSA